MSVTANVEVSSVETATVTATTVAAASISVSALESAGVAFDAITVIGPQGATGPTPALSVSAFAISPNSQPTVAQGGTAEHPTIALGIPSGATFNVDEFLATGGAVTRTYATPPSPSTRVFVNGLRQSASAFSLSCNSVVLPLSLSLMAGDLVEIEY